jgi:hypothetical protein
MASMRFIAEDTLACPSSMEIHAFGLADVA